MSQAKYLMDLIGIFGELNKRFSGKIIIDFG
jgi:hypothetical protein